ncbi:hypothetical protein GOP47_0001037, partial [Adiantum capillus-veneris]
EGERERWEGERRRGRGRWARRDRRRDNRGAQRRSEVQQARQAEQTAMQAASDGASRRGRTLVKKRSSPSTTSGSVASSCLALLVNAAPQPTPSKLLHTITSSA